MESKRARFTVKERAWILYDWANSVYATNIMAAIFPTIFVSFAGEAGDQWWGYATSLATLIVAILAPILGAVADYKGMKKKLFTAFMLAGVVFTAMIAVTGDWRVMLAGYVLSRIGFSGSCLFYDSFLTDVTTNERMDKVSSWGYAMGYIGGSTIPFIASIAMLLVLGYGSPVAQKFAILITSVWWLAFSIPFIRKVEQVHYIERTGESSVKQTFSNIWKTAKDIFTQKGLFIFVLAYFFYIDGVGTIISISTAYGTTLGLGAVGMILALLVTQIVAMPCSILFAKLAAKVSARKALQGAILVYTFICVVGFVMGFTLEPHQERFEQAYKQEIAATVAEGEQTALLSDIQAALRGKDAAGEVATALEKHPEAPEALRTAALAFPEANAQMLADYQGALSFSTLLFWAMATLVGTVQGGIQAVSRSYFGKLVPKARSNEFFGFFDIFGKFASVVGPFLYAVIAGLTGRSSYGVLCLVVLFLAGYGLLVGGRKHLDASVS